MEKDLDLPLFFNAQNTEASQAMNEIKLKYIQGKNMEKEMCFILDLKRMLRIPIS